MPDTPKAGPDTAPSRIRNRIIGSGEVDPKLLTANPKNWRIHPAHQREALKGVLDDVGFVQNVVVNKTTGFVVDGHLRVSVAIERDEPLIPVVFVELTEEEEAKILATIDPIGALAGTDTKLLSELLAEIETRNASVQTLLDGIALRQGLSGLAFPPMAPIIGEQNVVGYYTVKITGRAGDHKEELVTALKAFLAEHPEFEATVAT